MRALIASGDFYAATSIRLSLARERVVCDTTDLEEDGLQMARLYEYDIILFDLMLPDMQGYRALRRARAAGVSAPILILSRPGELDQKLKFLRSGADDFLSKPFDSRELIARIHAIVRRSNGHSGSTIRTGKLVVNMDTRSVSVDEQPVHLTNKEYAILELLSLRKGTIVTREKFLYHLYGGMDEPDPKTLDVFICKLRNKLARSGGRHYIETVWGHGYMLRDRTSSSGTVPPNSARWEGATVQRRDAQTAIGQTVSALAGSGVTKSISP
jgi:two-component system, cell cycle response regulator CtrA